MVGMAAMVWLRSISFVTLATVSVTLFAQSVPPSRQTGTGAISGVVIDADTRRPIAGALVYLGMAGYGPVGAQSQQITDAKGRFVYTDLPASNIYFMNVSKAGYINGHYGDRAASTSNLAPGRIALAAGQWFDQATILMWRPGAIAGTVTDERGEPVTGAYVRALVRVQLAGLPHLAAGPAATTDDRGRYRIPGLSPGDYIINVPSVQTAVPAATPAMTVEGLTADTAARNSDQPRRNNGALALDSGNLLVIGNYVTPPSTAGAPQAYPMTFYPGSTLLSASVPIRVRGGETRDGIDVTVRPAPAVRVSGRVVGNVASAAGMVLRLIAPGLDDLGEASEAATTMVAGDGRFTFLNVPAGDYTLVASRASLEYHAVRPSDVELPGTPGQVPGPGRFLGGIPSGPPGTNASGSHTIGDVNVWARVAVSVGASDVTDVVVPLKSGSSMRGRIAWDGDGQPPGPTAIVAEPAGGSAWLGMPQTAARASFDDDVRFAISGFLPGEYMLRVIGITPRHAVKSITIGGRDYSTRPIDASNGQDFDEVVVTYTDRIASITGSVQTGGNDDVMLSVLAFPMEREQWTKYGLSAPRIKRAGVSNAGQYNIENIPAGRYYLIALDTNDANRWQDPAFLNDAAKGAATITVAWGEAKTQDLKVSVIK